MSQSLISNHAARVLASVAPDMPADAALRRHLSGQRRFLPQEKRDIVRAVFAYYRWFRWLDERDSPQTKIENALILQSRFEADPASIKDQALIARAAPNWVTTELSITAAWARQLQQEPALWLRARPGTGAELAKNLGNCDPAAAPQGFLPAMPDTLRYRGTKDLFLTPEFKTGLFELQDLSSQYVGLAASPEAKQTWWDACAGEGGKLLHLADLMGNKGLIWASDRSERRLYSLKLRTARAKIFNYRSAFWDGSPKLPTKTKFDGVLVDAPCSGLGTWQRNPHARWTTVPNDVAELAVVQRALLENVSGSLKPGGRLVYAVCTLTRSETTDVAENFTKAHPEFEPVSVFKEGPAQITLWPHELNANGMFIATWKKKPGPS